MAQAVDWNARLASLGVEYIREFKDENVARRGINTIEFRCVCGTVATMLKHNIQTYKSARCISCYKAEKSASIEADSLARIHKAFEGKESQFLRITQRASDTSHLMIYVRCKCGTEFECTWNTKFIKSAPVCRPCLNERYMSVRGADHPNFDPAIPEAARADRRNGDTMRWYRAVIALYDNACAITGEKSRFGLAAHHLYNYKDHVELRLEVSNGVCIKRNLHILFHRLYGRKGNTLEQFQEFFLNQTGRTFVPRTPS